MISLELVVLAIFSSFPSVLGGNAYLNILYRILVYIPTETVGTSKPNRRTKKTEIFVVFEKKYDDGTVKLVKLRNLIDKSLSLKTIFRKD